MEIFHSIMDVKCIFINFLIKVISFLMTCNRLKLYLCSRIVEIYGNYEFLQTRIKIN
jgi:hypothetical protein